MFNSKFETKEKAIQDCLQNSFIYSGEIEAENIKIVGHYIGTETDEFGDKREENILCLEDHPRIYGGMYVQISQAELDFSQWKGLKIEDIIEWVWTAFTNKLVDAVKKYAKENYEKDGWDFIVECYEDEDIFSEIKNCRTEKGAISKIRKLAKLHNYQRMDVQKTRW